MRLLPTLILIPALGMAHAQVDINKMIQERMAKQGSAGQPGGGDVKVEDDNDPFVPNTFLGSFRMEMHHYDGQTEKKNSPNNMRYWSAADMTSNQMILPESGGQEMRMLTDLKGKWQYVLMTDKKGKKTAMKSRKKKVSMSDAGDRSAAKPKIEVTNETKVIEGHTCTKTIVTTEEGVWTGWVAKDLRGPFQEMLRNMRQGSDAQMVKGYDDVLGFPLEYEWVASKGTDRMVCHIRELKVGPVDASAFSLDGYEVTEMPSFGQ